MVQSTIRCALPALLLTLTLTSSAASAAPLAGTAGGGWRGAAWSWFADALGLAKHGCEIDPNGTPRCAPAVAPKLGCEINPDGTPRCAPAVAPKLGCEIDPNGKPRCTP